MSELFAFVALIFSAVAYSRAGRLERKVEELMKNAGVSSPETSSRRESAPAAAESVVPMPQAAKVSSSADASQSQSISREPDLLTQFFHWCAIDWPMKLGAALVFLAVGWIVTVVFWDMIGPFGQVTLGLALGIFILVFGSRRIVTSANQGSVLIALGAGVIYLTIFAARFEYDFFTPSTALLFMFLVAVFVGFVSVVRKYFALALLGLFLGGIAPLLVHSGRVDVAGLFSYLFVLVLGTLWVTRLTGWRHLTTAGIALYALYAAPFMIDANVFSPYRVDPDQSVKVFVAMIFATLFFIANVLAIIYDRAAQKSDLFIGLFNGLILLGWIGTVIPPEWRSLAAILAALVASVGAYLIHMLTGLKEPVYIHSSVALVFIGMATAYELSGSALVIAYALEAMALVFGTRFVTQSDAAARSVSVAALPALLLSLESFERYSYSQEVFTKDFFALVLVIAMTWALAGLFRKQDMPPTRNAGKIFFSVATIISLAFVWPFTRAVFGDADTATTVSLILYTVLGMSCYVRGKLVEKKEMRRFGSALLLLVTGHLLLIDIWNMDVSGRIITFTVIGVLFMSTAFIGKKKMA
jgi:uncharacterized membrane protein